MTILQERIKVVNPYKTSTPIMLVRQSLIGIVMTLHLLSALKREINWDEFYFLSLVQDYERGTCFHCRPFALVLVAVKAPPMQSVKSWRGA
jgi:hypothetical protein